MHFQAAHQAARIQIEAVWRKSGLWIRILDPHLIWIQGPVWRAPVFNSSSTNHDGISFGGTLVHNPLGVVVVGWVGVQKTFPKKGKIVEKNQSACRL